MERTHTAAKPVAAPSLLGLSCAMAVLSGVLASVLLGIPEHTGRGPVAALLVVLGCAGWLLPWRLRPWMLCVGAFGWGHMQMESALAARLTARDAGRVVRVAGQVEGLPMHDDRRSRFQLRVDDDEEMPARLRGALLQVSWFDPRKPDGPGARLQVEAGARWQFDLRLRAMRGLVNPGGWDSERQALARHVVGQGLVVGAAARQLHAASGIDAVRERLARRLQSLSPPAAPFLRALALGDTRGLGQQDWLALRATGLSHLVAISGFHVGVVAGGCALLAGVLLRLWPMAGRWLPRPQAVALVGGMGALAYAALAGFSLPTRRALLMVLVVLLVRLCRRRVSPALPLSAALIVVMLRDPLSVLLPGFWLSFAGVAWLAWCMPSTQRLPRWRQLLSAQVVATLGLFPLGVAWFDQASLPGPLINLLAIPWWSAVVVPLALLGLLAELVWEGGGAWPWWLAGHALQGSWTLFCWLAPMEDALVWFPGVDAAAALLGTIGVAWWLLPRPMPGRWLGGVLCLPMLLPPDTPPDEGGVRMTVLDVGQGLAVLVQTSGHALLYDAGPSAPGGYDGGARIVVPALRALGVRSLSMLMLSHADRDHAGGVGAVLAAMPVGQLRVPPGVMLGQADTCHAGQRWDWDGVRFSVLAPAPGARYRGNPSSCVLRIEAGGRVLLLTGDIGVAEERQLLRVRAEQPLAADVVVAAHHGSRTSSGSAWVAATAPALVVFSAGHGNRFGHPHREVAARWQGAGAETLLTADAGAVQVWAGPQSLQLRALRPWRARRWDAAERDHMAAILSDDEQPAVRPEE